MKYTTNDEYMRELTRKQARVLEFVQKFIMERGYPPTIREIGTRFRFGPRAAKEHLDAIERKGYIKRRKGARAIEISYHARVRFEGVPLVGKVAAGSPILAEENLEGYVGQEDYFPRGDRVFFLKVKGESMKGSGLFEGDLVLVRKQNVASQGDIVVARIGDEATVKRYHEKKGRVSLIPDNPDFDTIHVHLDEDFEILGKVIGLWRKI